MHFPWCLIIRMDHSTPGQIISFSVVGLPDVWLPVHPNACRRTSWRLLWEPSTYASPLPFYSLLNLNFCGSFAWSERLGCQSSLLRNRRIEAETQIARWHVKADGLVSMEVWASPFVGLASVKGAIRIVHNLNVITQHVLVAMRPCPKAWRQSRACQDASDAGATK